MSVSGRSLRRNPDRKGIHISFSHENHLKIRTMLVKYNMSIARVFETFAVLLAEENPNAIAILEVAIRDVNRSKISRPRAQQHTPLSVDINDEALYDLIENSHAK